MTGNALRNCAVTVIAAWLLAACSSGNSGDAPPPGSSPASAPPPSMPGQPTVSTIPNTYLLGPNRLQQPNGSFQIDTVEFAQAYYRAIDPLNEKDTLLKWKAANLFDTGTGTQVTVVFGDVEDLGYGRRMTARQNMDGTIAVLVNNYLVDAVVEYEFSTLNLDAAIVEDPPWFIGTSAAEFSPGPGSTVSFTKFFWFNPTTGQRELQANLDGQGLKAMPSACIACHGGRQLPLTPPDATGNRLFARLPNSASMARGDVQAWFHPLKVDTLAFSTMPGFTRAEQEAALKTINKMVLCSYPLPGTSAFAEDACRRPAVANEWQGTAAARIKSGYGGDGLPNPTFTDSLVPSGWATAGQSALYRDVLARSCSGCHSLRGTGFQSDIDFNSFAKFQGHSGRVKFHVLDRGDMPHARIIYNDFWNSTAPGPLANFLETEGFTVRDGAGTVLIPGRPVAVPGPNRVVTQGPTTLSGANSLFSASYDWSIVSGPDGVIPPANVTLTNPTSATPTFDATADGTYVVRLQTSNGTLQSAPVDFDIVVDNTLTPAASVVRFADIKASLQGIGCTGCHFVGFPTPISFTDIDRNGDAMIGDATDDLWFYEELRGRINFNDVAASRLLRKPAGQHHGGGQRPGFDTSAAPGQAARARYDLFLNWILNDAPQ